MKSEASSIGKFSNCNVDAQPIFTCITSEVPVRRVMSAHASTSNMTPWVSTYPQDERVQDSPLISFKQREFRDAVRERDGVCTMSGYQSIPRDDFSGLQAVHIYPLSHKGIWDEKDYQRWITDNAPASEIGSNKIHSPQNGLLLNSLLHHLFDVFKVAVNVNVRVPVPP